eukprot:7946193-Pyramimonas_sp.AAC.1
MAPSHLSQYSPCSIQADASSSQCDAGGTGGLSGAQTTKRRAVTRRVRLRGGIACAPGTR